MGVGRAALLKNGDTFIFRKKETHGVGHGFHRKLRLIANTEGDLFFVEIGDRLDRGSGRGGGSGSRVFSGALAELDFGEGEFCVRAGEFELGFAEVVGADDQGAENLFGEVAVAFDVRDLGALGAEVGEHVDAALLATDFVGELAFVPFTEGDDFRVSTTEDFFEELDGRGEVRGGVLLVEEEQAFVLVPLDFLDGGILDISHC